MKISIIIPVYNVEQYVVQCLQSVADQTWKDGEIECIVVDDCGTDRSMALVEEFISSYSGRIDFKVVRHEMNRGISAARNSGIKCSSGDFLCFIDSDDYIDQSFIDVLISGFKCNPSSIGIVSCCCAYDVDGILSNGPWSFDTNIVVEPQFFAEQTLLEKIPHSAWGKLYDHSLFEEVLFREGIINEDSMFMFDLYPVIEQHQLSTIVLPDNLYYYRQHSKGICHSSTNPLILSVVANTDEIIHNLKRDGRQLFKELEYVQFKRLVDCGKIFKNRNHKYHQYYPFVVAKLSRFTDMYAMRKLRFRSFVLFLMMKYLPGVYSALRG